MDEALLMKFNDEINKKDKIIHDQNKKIDEMFTTILHLEIRLSLYENQNKYRFLSSENAKQL